MIEMETIQDAGAGSPLSPEQMEQLVHKLTEQLGEKIAARHEELASAPAITFDGTTPRGMFGLPLQQDQVCVWVRDDQADELCLIVRIQRAGSAPDDQTTVLIKHWNCDRRYLDQDDIYCPGQLVPTPWGKADFERWLALRSQC